MLVFMVKTDSNDWTVFVFNLKYLSQMKNIGIKTHDVGEVIV